jgi:hypothetical protein
MNEGVTMKISHYQTISTKYLGPTNCKGARIKATSSSGNSKTMSYEHALNNRDNHIAACKALADHWGWDGEWVGGEAAKGYVFIRV